MGNLYGCRTWIEYGFRQGKQELGWTNYRLTDFQNIEKWWEIIFSVYLMISLNSQVFVQRQPQGTESSNSEPSDCHLHQHWNHKGGWKNTLNNLRLLIQPTILFGLISPWLDIFPSRKLWLGFNELIRVINQFPFHVPDG